MTPADDLAGTRRCAMSLGQCARSRGATSDPKMPRPAPSSDLHDQMRLGHLLRLLLQAGRRPATSSGSCRPTWLSLVTQVQKVGPSRARPRRRAGTSMQQCWAGAVLARRSPASLACGKNPERSRASCTGRCIVIQPEEVSSCSQISLRCDVPGVIVMLKRAAFLVRPCASRTASARRPPRQI